jgi:peptidyl-prolyl cis-trans isomerase C
MIPFRALVFVCPLACLLAQPPASRQATPVPPPPPADGANAGQPAPGTRTVTIPVLPAPPTLPPETVVLTVGDTKITAREFNAIADALPEQSRAWAKGPGRRAFADQIAKVLSLAQQGRRLKYDQRPEFAIQSRYRDNELLASYVQSAVADDISIDDAALREYYEAHKSEWAQVRARHILIRTEGSPVPLKPGEKDLTDAEGLAKATQIIAQIKGGEDFAAIAAKESDDTGSAANGGELGWFSRGQMVPSFEEAAFRLKPGELSGPVKSQFGYHIILTEEVKVKSFDEQKAIIEQKLKPERIRQALDDLQKTVSVEYNPDFYVNTR